MSLRDLKHRRYQSRLVPFSTVIDGRIVVARQHARHAIADRRDYHQSLSTLKSITRRLDAAHAQIRVGLDAVATEIGRAMP